MEEFHTFAGMPIRMVDDPDGQDSGTVSFTADAKSDKNVLVVIEVLK